MTQSTPPAQRDDKWGYSKPPQRQDKYSPPVQTDHVVVTVATLKDGKNTLRLHVYGPYTKTVANREARRIEREYDQEKATLAAYARPLLDIPEGY